MVASGGKKRITQKREESNHFLAGNESPAEDRNPGRMIESQLQKRSEPGGNNDCSKAGRYDTTGYAVKAWFLKPSAGYY